MKEKEFPSELLTRLARDGQAATILDALPVGVEIYTPDGRIMFMSRTDARIFGTDRDRFVAAEINIQDNKAIPSEVREAVRCGKDIHLRFPYDFSIIEQTEYYETSRTQAIHLECNGKAIYNAAGEYTNYIFITQDVTESVYREEELAQSRRKTELAIRDSDIMLWELDVRNGAFFSDNEPMNSYDKSKPISIEMYIETVHPEDRAPVEEIMRRMVAGEDFSFTFDGRILLPGNSEWQYCSVNGSPYERDEQGRVIRFVGTRKNNTELQKIKLLQDKILNSIPLPIHIKDIENDYRYVFCNDEGKRMFGTSVEGAAYDVMDDDQVARIRKNDKEVVATGKPYFGLERIELRDGRVYDMIVRKSIIQDNGKTLLLNIHWDQSLQNDLERRAKVLSISMEAMDAYSWFFEPGKDLVSYGEGFERPGRTISQLDTLDKFLAHVHPEDRDLFAGSIGAVIPKESGQWDVEYRVDLTGSGVYEWWQIRGMLETTLRGEVPYKYMFGMSINIEAHKQAELTLLRNKEELNTLIRQNELVLNNTNSGLAYITTDYIVQWENITVCSASLSYEAYKKGELCYKSAHGRKSPCRDCVMQRAMQSRQTEQIKFSLNNNHTVEIFATPVFRDNGEVDGVVIRVDDITEREQMIQEMQHARRMAEQSDKLKSAFLANMSHEIRTPLNAIVGFSELLISSTDPEEKDEYIRIINNNNELLLKLINDILDLSKIEAGSVELKYEEFDLAEYFNEITTTMKQRITNPNVRLLVVNPHPSCLVRLDKNRIAQLITNFGTNAIKYTPKGYIEAGYESTEEGIRFYVRDSGIGIPDEKKNKVFHRFEKLDEFAQGTGLGLSICKAIAESMGGSVGFESNYGEGSYFWAFLPCDPLILDSSQLREKTAGSEPASAAPDTGASNTSEIKTILVAEDIPSNYLLVSALLKDQYDLVHALNGQQAVELVKTCRPDLVLMDMKMPLMDGLTATAEIRKFDATLPVIALTAHAFDADRQAAFEVGCNEYLVKPIDKAKLMSVLRKYCGKGSQ